MAPPNNKPQPNEDLDDDLFDENNTSSDIDSDFEMLSEEELNKLFDDSGLIDSDETLPGDKDFGTAKKGSDDARLPDDWKDFDFGDDDFDY